MAKLDRLARSTEQAELLLRSVPYVKDRVAAIERFKDEVAAWDGTGERPRLHQLGESTTEMPSSPGVTPEDPRLSTKESER